MFQVEGLRVKGVSVSPSAFRFSTCRGSGQILLPGDLTGLGCLLKALRYRVCLKCPE